MRISIITTTISIVLLVAACGPPKPAKTPKDINSDDQSIKAQPKRQISTEAKADFTEAIKRYQAAKKAGNIKSNCDGLAGAFADVYESFPKLVEAKFNEGVVWEECGDMAKADQVYQAILRKHPKHGPTLNNVGRMLYRKGQTGAALSYFQRAAAAKNSEGYTNLALMQRQRALNNDTEALREAVNNIHRALAVDSFNIEAYALLGTLLYDHARTRSQLEMARLICVQATKVDANFAPIYNTLGLILLKMGKVTPALAEFRKALDRDGNFIEALMNVGAITLSFRDYSTAETSFRKVIQLTSDKRVKYAATVGLGVALRGQAAKMAGAEKQAKLQEALAKYKEAKKIDPSNADIAYNMAILIQDYTFDASNPAQGIQTLQKSVRLLNQYMNGAKNRSQFADARRRIKNINEMIPMLREQQKMMEQMQKGQ